MAFQEDLYRFLISIIDKNKIKLSYKVYSDVPCDDDFGDFNDHYNEVYSIECNFVDTPCLLLIITFRFTCGERNIWSNIRKSQNVITTIVDYYSKSTAPLHPYSYSS